MVDAEAEQFVLNLDEDVTTVETPHVRYFQHEDLYACALDAYLFTLKILLKISQYERIQLMLGSLFFLRRIIIFTF